MACLRNPPSEKFIYKKKKNLRIHPEKREKEEKKTASFLLWGEVKGREKAQFFLKRALNLIIGSTKEL